MKKILYAFTITFLLSCSNQRETKIEIIKEFPHSISITHQQINTPPLLFSIGEMQILDSVLVAFDTKSVYFFKIFKLPNFNYIGEYITKGRGPEEEINIDPFFNKLSGNKFIYKSLNTVKFACFNLNENKLEIIKTIQLPSELLDFSHIFTFHDSIIGGWIYNQLAEKEFVVFSTKEKTMDEFGPVYSNIVDNIPINTRASIFSKVITVKPDNLRIAVVYDKFQMLRIIDNKGILIKEIRFENSTQLPDGMFKGNVRGIDSNKIILHYQRIQSTNKYIYALYSGKSQADFINIEGATDIGTEIHVWNWDGVPIVKIRLDKECSSFAVDPNDKFGISSSVYDIDKLYFYDFDELKNIL
jgi:hypothetical protein